MPQSQTESQATKAPSATFLTEHDRATSLSDLIQNDAGLPTLFAFFKVSCPTCRLTWPYLQKLHEAYGGRAVRVLGVSQNDVASSRAYYRDFGAATFDLVLDPEPAFPASNLFDVESVPHLVLVGADGLVRKVWAGWQRKELEAVASQIAREAGVPEVPLIAQDDPVVSWKAG